VIADVEGHVQQFADLLRRRRRLHRENAIQGLQRRQLMGLGAHPADAAGDRRHFFGPPPHAELLEASQLRNLEVRVRDITLFIQKCRFCRALPGA
jgi:hypothetical protein